MDACPAGTARVVSSLLVKLLALCPSLSLPKASTAVGLSGAGPVAYAFAEQVEWSSLRALSPPLAVTSAAQVVTAQVSQTMILPRDLATTRWCCTAVRSSSGCGLKSKSQTVAHVLKMTRMHDQNEVPGHCGACGLAPGHLRLAWQRCALTAASTCLCYEQGT